MEEEGLFDALKQFAKDGGAFFGTCAGAILLATQVHGPSQDSLALLDMSDASQRLRPPARKRCSLRATKLRKEPLEMVFIRAPIIESVGKEVEILAEDAGHPVLVRARPHPGIHFSSRVDRRLRRPRIFPETCP